MDQVEVVTFISLTDYDVTGQGFQLLHTHHYILDIGGGNLLKGA